MALSAPIFQLKRKAKSLARTENIPLNRALDRVAMDEGFSSWSALASSPRSLTSSASIFNELECGEILLLGGRPGQGKTQMALQLVVEAMKQGHKGVYFSLDYNKQDIVELFSKIKTDQRKFKELFQFDSYDHINAAYIIKQMQAALSGTIVVIDYLQLLDQRRLSPIVGDQLRELRDFVRKQGLKLVVLSQIDRSFELTNKKFPDLKDVRLPNPFDISLFDKACFMNEGEFQMQDQIN